MAVSARPAARARGSRPTALARAGDGFTLIEILVALAVMVVLAATIVPSVVTSLDRARIRAAEKSLQALADGIADFYADVGEMPRGMTQLVTPLSPGSRDICGDVFTGAQRTTWAGPYLNRPVPPAGFPIGIGTAAEAFAGDPGPPGDPTLLSIVVSPVLVEDALALDARLDGDGDPTTGVIRWGAPDASGYVVMRWAIPISSC